MAAPSVDIDICNLALDLIKQNKKLVADITTTPTSEEEITCARWYDATREALLRSHFWHFARRRKQLVLVSDTISGATQADPVVITATAHSYSDGDSIRINDVEGMTELNGNTYIVANSAANTFELNDISGADIDGTGFTAYTSAGVAVPFHFGYADTYNLPSDYLRFHFIGDDSIRNYKFDYAIEGTQILVNNSGAASLNLAYIKNASTVSEFDSLFVILLAAELAENISYKFTLKNTVIQRLETLLDRKRREAKAVNGQDKPPVRVQGSKFLGARKRLTTSVAGKFTIFEF